MTMNTFAIIILVALVLEFSLELAGNLLNLKALKFELAPVLQGIYKPEDYRKSQEYMAASHNWWKFDLAISYPCYS